VSADPSALAGAFLERARYFLTVEYRTKIALVLEQLPAEAIWARPAPGSNAIGNLLLHLAGNIRQWIVSGISGAADVRQRSAEFTARDGTSGPELLAHLDAALRDVDAVLAGLSPAALLESRRIQSRDVTVLAAIFHVVEHFGGHTGQIILLAKILAPGTVRFYEDEPTGQAKPLWQDALRPLPPVAP
jgi:uncharacterized damage-inducible protein DinB